MSHQITCICVEFEKLQGDIFQRINRSDKPVAIGICKIIVNRPTAIIYAAVGTVKYLIALTIIGITIGVGVREAIDDQLKCIFVDNGLLRKNEAHDVIEIFRNDLCR